MMETLELLAPARDLEVGKTAINAGADAVYIGAPAFGARAAATNTVEDIAELVKYAHQFKARVYVTLNTILYNNELEEACKLVFQLYGVGVDAIIVQDMAYVEMDLPPIALHASTQCDIRTPEKARWLAEAGFSQLVLPREFSVEEIRQAREVAGVPVEVFVHGALCVSYSGDCHAGHVAMGRSANRGMCSQMCRLPYELVDENGKVLAPERHYLSLRDMNRSANLEELALAGASSFKIEGRLKDGRYVANVVASYSKQLDKIVAKYPDRFRRASFGKSTVNFTPDLEKTFNRSYTNYFPVRQPGIKMASIATPKWVGAPVGTVTAVNPRQASFTAKLKEELHNGDGLSFFDAKGQFHGFRLNKIAGNTLFPASPLEGLTEGTVLYRNSDKVFNELHDRKDACSRQLSLDLKLSLSGIDTIVLDVCDEMGNKATVCEKIEVQTAQKDPRAKRAETLARLGGTIYRAGIITDSLDQVFLPASTVAELRRRALDALQAQAQASYEYDRRKKDCLPADAFKDMPQFDYHANVANAKAMQFYMRHGGKVVENAVEVQNHPKNDGRVVMTTKYCIRRELGACLMDKNAKMKLPSPLFLRNPSGLYRLDFDCKRCGMQLVNIKGQ